MRRELARNAEHATERARRIAAALRWAGGVPDVVTPALGRVGAVVTSVTAQAEPLAGALLDDLAVEHQLADRARYLRALATSAGNTSVVRLADRLIAAHDETIAWLTTVLAEEALGGPAALRATPLQAVTGTAARVAAAPVRLSAAGVNRAVASVGRTRTQVADAAQDLTDRAGVLAGDVAKTATAARDAGLGKAEELARRDGSPDLVDTVHQARAATGSLQAHELRIANYDELNATAAAEAVSNLDKPAELRAVLGYEETHKSRRSVITAVTNRITSLAQDATGTR